MTSREAPPAVEEAARQRSTARAERDWATADRLRDEIEAAGWRVVDAGSRYRLERAAPPTLEVGGEVRYGRSDDVPSRLDEPATGLATLVLLASTEANENRQALAAVQRFAPAGVDVVVVADGLADDAVDLVDLRIAHECIRTSASLGRGAALNIGIRRAAAPVIVVLDPSIVPAGDVVTPLVATLDDPGVAVSGPIGLVSSDLHRFEEVRASERVVNAAAIEGYLMAFRRADAVACGPVDEGFRFYRNLDIWWSLVLRDAGEGSPARRAAVVPNLAFERGEPAAWRTTRSAVRDRLSKRNFYRVLNRFRTRLDLAVPAAES